MALKVGVSDVTDVKLGATQVAKVMLGAEQVWPTAPPQPGYRYLNSWHSPNYDVQGVCRAAGGGRKIFNFVDLDGKDAADDLRTATTIQAVYVDDGSTYYDGPVDVTEPNYHGVGVEMNTAGIRGDDMREFIITHINGVALP